MTSCPPPTPPTPPLTLAAFKAAYGRRDFRFGDGADTVMDEDVTQAMVDAMTVYNPVLFSTEEAPILFGYLTAHFIRTNIQAVGGLRAVNEGLGIENQGEQVLSSAGGAGVTASYVEPPARVKRNSFFLQLWGTTYGQKYVNLALSRTTGATSVVDGPIDVGTIGIPPIPFAGFGP